MNYWDEARDYRSEFRDFKQEFREFKGEFREFRKDFVMRKDAFVERVTRVLEVLTDESERSMAILEMVARDSSETRKMNVRLSVCFVKWLTKCLNRVSAGSSATG